MVEWALITLDLCGAEYSSNKTPATIASGSADWERCRGRRVWSGCWENPKQMMWETLPKQLLGVYKRPKCTVYYDFNWITTKLLLWLFYYMRQHLFQDVMICLKSRNLIEIINLLGAFYFSEAAISSISSFDNQHNQHIIDHCKQCPKLC